MRFFMAKSFSSKVSGGWNRFVIGYLSVYGLQELLLPVYVVRRKVFFKIV